MKRKLTEEEKRELEIVMLAYELQDEDSEEECKRKEAQDGK